MGRGLTGAVLAAGSAAFVVLTGVAGPAAASTYQVTFAASDFNFQPAPTPFVLGQIDVSFDPASVGADFANGPATLDFLNMNISNVGYFYNGYTDELALGGIVFPGDAANGMSPGEGHDDFMMWITSFSTSPTFGSFEYSEMSDLTHFHTSNTGSVHVAVSATSGPSVSTTPIPAALPLFISALGGLGIVGWKRRKGVA